jgi:hypothetical protein
MPSMMQVLMNYPVFDAGWMMAPRGFGTMLAMFLVARVINRIDNRLFILAGIGIAILETQLSQNTQIVHSRLIEHLRPDNPLAQAPYLTAPFSLTDPSGIAALTAESRANHRFLSGDRATACRS